MNSEKEISMMREYVMAMKKVGKADSGDCDNLLMHIDNLSKGIDATLKNINDEETSRCIGVLQDVVQEKIVPIDPPFIISGLKTIDAAIIFYIQKLETEIVLLKRTMSQ